MLATSPPQRPLAARLRRCVTQCTERTGMAQSLVSKHLSRLIDTGLVQRRRDGRRSYHSVIDPEGLHGLLRAAEHLAHPPEKWL